MRIAFLADIHANLEALEACRVDLRARKVERVVYLGDIVGYGADPGPCLDIVRADCMSGSATALMGNHDEAVEGSRFRLNGNAEAAIQWTRSVLDAEQKKFLAALPMAIEDAGRLYVHASAAKPASFPYVHGLHEARDSLMATQARLAVIGHVHAPALYHMTATGKVMGFVPVADTPIPLSSQRRWLAVMGAVGQPRDGNPAAAYAILETASDEITFIRVPYDVERAAAKIRAAGLPDALWKRLSVGR
jgi:diadenosine tetraphosphatase ApaH/serine/threonine PP2A family protein phosphatase